MSNRNKNKLNINQMVTRKLKAKKCCAVCSGILVLPVRKTYCKRKTRLNSTVAKNNSCTSAEKCTPQSNESLQSVNNPPTYVPEVNSQRNIIFLDCSIVLENVDILKYSNILNVNLPPSINNTEELIFNNLILEKEQSEPKPSTSVDVESLIKENVEIIISDDDDDDNEDNRCSVINAKRDLTSITFLEMISVSRRNSLFPKYCQEKIEEMREFFANQSSVLKPFAKPEKYTVNEVLELMSKPTRWLTESDINSYFALIEEASHGRMTFYRTFFISPNTGNSSEPIKFNIPKTMSDPDLFSKQMLMIPLNLNRSHWILVCFDFTTKMIFYFDSLYGVKDHYPLCIFLHLQKQAETLNIKLDPDDWKLQECDSPKQYNFYDCGIFVCNNAWNIIQGIKPNYEQSEIPLVRQRMAYELINGELIF